MAQESCAIILPQFIAVCVIALTSEWRVIKSYNTTKGFEHTTYAMKPKHLAHWTMAAVGDIGLKVQYKLAHVGYTPARA